MAMAVVVALNSCHRFLLPPTATTTTTFSSFAPKTRNPYPQLLLRSPFRYRFMAAGAPVKVKERIELTETERRIFDRLLEFVRYFSLHTQLRVAGGWVRDKLLGRECYDIDVALDNMLGKDFCDKLEEYLKCVGEEPRGRADIKSNPDQSKHLETARMRIFNTWIDFVNLRSETYVENSRIPTMKFGTAEEDAYRRDLTINSLFYNINTDSVEDLTGRGLSDLKFGLIVTPLPPKATFLDDPLRVLRAIRFGARFEFVLDEELKKAAADEEVKAALADKISKERIGHEIDLMISGNQPVKAMSYILELQLFWTVFALPSDSEPTIAVDCDRLCTAFMNTALSVLKILESSVIDGGQQRLYLYAALFIPLRKLVYTDRKRKKVPVTNYIFQNSLKLKNSDAEMVVSLHRASEKFVSLIPFLTQNEDLEIAGTYMEEEFLTLPLHSKRRISAGLLLQEIKGYWRAALLLSTLLSDSVSHVEEHLSGASAVDVKIDLFRRIEKVIIQLELEDVWEMKPLLDGNVIMSTLQIKSGGPIVNQWKQRALKWQLAYPSGTADECLDWIKGSNAKRAKVA